MKNKFLIFIIFLISLFFFSGKSVLASETDGVISAPGYAWGENMAWFNFAANGSNIRVTDTAVTGYAWSHLYGWMNMGPDRGSVTNTPEGQLGGNAWSPLGWVDFSGVKISATGKFDGLAGTQGTLAGRINFSCDKCNVLTDWRPLSSRTQKGKQLFDITFNVDSQCLMDSRKLASTTTFTSFGTVDTPVNMTFIVLDSQGEERYNTTGKTVIQTEGVFHQEFAKLSLPRGKYTLVMNTLYNVDVKDTFQQPFEVSSVCYGRCLLSVWIVIFELLIIGYLLWRWYKEKKKERELNQKTEPIKKEIIKKGEKKI